MSPARERADQGQSSFATTRWSQVARAGRGDSDGSRAALAALCEAYWYPLYAYARRRGRTPDDAREATQGFFAELLAQRALASADPARGRFRAFLIGAFDHFCAKQRRFWRALKRGGGRATLSLDFDSAEARYEREPLDTQSPERLFEASWARTLIERAFVRLQVEYARGGKLALFERLRAELVDQAGPQRYRELAAELAMTEGALKVAIHRLRKRFRAALEHEIGDTLDNAAEIDDEIRHLFEALGR